MLSDYHGMKLAWPNQALQNSRNMDDRMFAPETDCGIAIPKVSFFVSKRARRGVDQRTASENGNNKTYAPIVWALLGGPQKHRSHKGPQPPRGRWGADT